MANTISNKDVDLIFDAFIGNIIIPRILKIRKQYAELYNINEGCFKNYRGLSYDMSIDLQNLLMKYFKKESDLLNQLNFDIKIVQGHQKRYTCIDSNDWMLKHTWIKLSILGKNLYVDLSSQEFTDIYDDIPDYYISKKKPKWYSTQVGNPLLDYLIKHLWLPMSNIIYKYTNKK